MLAQPYTGTTNEIDEYFSGEAALSTGKEGTSVTKTIVKAFKKSASLSLNDIQVSQTLQWLEMESWRYCPRWLKPFL